MAVIYCYLGRGSYKALKFHGNYFSYFEFKIK